MRNLLLFLCFFLALFSAGWADMGPKPTFNIALAQTPGKPKLTIVAATLWCRNEATSDFQKFREMGPQRFEVKPDGLFAMAYGFPTFLKLEVKFSDGETRTSQVFKTHGLRSNFQMTVQDKSLQVKPVESSTK